MVTVSKRQRLRAKASAKQQQLEEANAKITERAGRNLIIAIGSGLAFGAIFLASLFLWEPLFLILVLVLSGVSLYELATAFRLSGRRVPRIGVILGALMIILGAWFNGAQGLLWGMFYASAFLLLWRLTEGLIAPKIGKRTMLADLSAGIFTLVYIPFLMSMAVLLRGASQNWQLWILTFIVLCVSCDIGAYVAGVFFGKHKMVRRISPNKTWEGFAGAAALVLITAVAAAVLLLEQPWYVGLILGFLILLTATGGDLVESLIKRNLGVKDMSSFLPGHGGLLDRLDSIIPSIVPVYATAIMVGVI